MPKSCHTEPIKLRDSSVILKSYISFLASDWLLMPFLHRDWSSEIYAEIMPTGTNQITGFISNFKMFYQFPWFWLATDAFLHCDWFTKRMWLQTQESIIYAKIMLTVTNQIAAIISNFNVLDTSKDEIITWHHYLKSSIGFRSVRCLTL